MEPNPSRRRTWLDQLPARLRARLDAEIDCRVSSLGAIYRRYNLVRFCQPRTWRLYAGERRRRIRDYDARSAAATRAARERGQQTQTPRAGEEPAP
jgi:hypothetical protein